MGENLRKSKRGADLSPRMDRQLTDGPKITAPKFKMRKLQKDSDINRFVNIQSIVQENNVNVIHSLLLKVEDNLDIFRKKGRKIQDKVKQNAA